MLLHAACNFDGGPLNKSKTVNYWYPQFCVDGGLVDVYLNMFYWKYRGKSEVDRWFGVIQNVLAVVAVIVGPEDMARILRTLPKGALMGEGNTALVLEPCAQPWLDKYLEGMFNKLDGFTYGDFHFCCFSSRLDRVPNDDLGLPGRWRGYGFRDFLKHLTS